jgi:hypothetical protein
MGLTIHYNLSTRRKLGSAGVKKLVASLHDQAAALEFDDPGTLFQVGPDYTWAFHWPPGARKMRDLLPPLDGWLFHATPGDGAESAQIGLCRYQGVPGWQLESFCKTQYASCRGWEHFFQCHRRVTALLRAAQALGLRVRVDDEGGYWKSGSAAALRRNLTEYDQATAAFGGALKDASAEQAGGIRSPIFEHPACEYLEAAGMAAQGEKVRQAVAGVQRLAHPAGPKIFPATKRR